MRKIVLTIAGVLVFAVMVAQAGHVADVPKNAGLDAVKALAGKWVSDAPPKDGEPQGGTQFTVTSGGTAVEEKLFPGSANEMVDVYFVDGDDLYMTHYCTMGVRPRMKLMSNEKGVMKFEFVDGGNIKDRNQPHMDSLTLVTNGDKLIEKWSFFEDGKITQTVVIEMHRVK